MTFGLIQFCSLIGLKKFKHCFDVLDIFFREINILIVKSYRIMHIFLFQFHREKNVQEKEKKFCW